MLSPTITRSLLSLNSLQPSNTRVFTDGKSMSKEQFRNPECYIFSEKPRVWFSVNKLWRSHSTLIWNFLYKNQLEHSPSWSPFPHTTHRDALFFYLKSTNPLHIKLAHPDSSALFPPYPTRLQGKSVCRWKFREQWREPWIVHFRWKRQLSSCFFWHIFLELFLARGMHKTARQNSPSPCFVQGVVWVGKNISYWTEKTFPCQ